MHKPRVFAHRGGRLWAPENTRAAYRKSVQAGMNIELDVRRCKTGELVCSHHPNIIDVTGGSGLIKDLTLDEIRSFNIRSSFSEFSCETMPLLSEALKIVGGKVIVNVEIKNFPYPHPGIEEDVALALSNYAHPDKVIVSSFDHQVLYNLQKFDLGCDIGLLMTGVLPDTLGYLQRHRVNAWHPAFLEVSRQEVLQAQSAGIAVNVWTANRPDEWDICIDLGADAIMTDDPVGLTAHLEKRFSGESM